MNSKEQKVEPSTESAIVGNTMLARSALLLAILMLVDVFCKAQDSTYKGLIELNDSSRKLITADFGLSIGSVSYGYQKISKMDTVKAVLLITECDSCQSKSVTAYAIREHWSVKSYLDSRKKAFPSTVTIWGCRLK